MNHKILVVEDETTLLDTLSYNLRRQGYDVQTATEGYAALELARASEPDLIILDVMLPEMDGFEICRVLRKEMNVPILMLTARDAEVDKVVGLEVGADDYMTKPFSMRELLARVKALLRRVRLIREEVAADQDEDAAPAGVATEPGRVETDEPLIFGNLELDLARREVRLEGQPVHLKPREYDLLLFLARNRGIALSRDLILDRVWGWDHDGSSRTVDVHIRWLREKIEPDPGTAQRIVTIRGIGYRFEG
ncbi:MAG: response regulator transcription factor [Candidatus Promineifilaceae bacterium]|nr:response regulator transcription factor [Candidatus Promineifilaceae bacterium]